MLHLYRSSRRFRLPRNSGLLPKSVTVKFFSKIKFFCNHRFLQSQYNLNKSITSPQLSCQTTVRKRSGKTISISKGCKQTEACVNNALTNPVNFWTPPSCSDENDLESGVYEKKYEFKIKQMISLYLLLPRFKVQFSSRLSSCF